MNPPTELPELESEKIADPVEGFLEKFKRLIGDALNDHTKLFAFKQELGTLLNSHDLTVTEGLEFLDRIADYIYELSEYSNYQRIAKNQSASGRSFHDFENPIDKRSMLLGNIIDGLPTKYTSVLKNID